MPCLGRSFAKGLFILTWIAAETSFAGAESTATATESVGGSAQLAPVASEGKVEMRGRELAYRVIAGELVVHPEGWQEPAPPVPAANTAVASAEADDAASVFFVAYFAKGFRPAERPLTFLYNGGPGSSTMWLHMGAFGPRRVVTADAQHSAPAPYQVVNNRFSLLDATDLVFIDAPGTGFSRVAGKNKEKAFYGMDADAFAFSRFVVEFLSRFGRWNSPKYLLGESYGTARTALLVNELQTRDGVDMNGVMLLSPILDFNMQPDDAQLSPANDQPYILALPTYAAIAWYYDKTLRAGYSTLRSYLTEVEEFASTDYAVALQGGSELNTERRRLVAERVAKYIGLPLPYVLKADLRINGGTFEKMIQDAQGLTVGRNDARFSGPSLDALSKEAGYDPQRASICSAFVAAFNDYARNTLGLHEGRTYIASLNLYETWNYQHRIPEGSAPVNNVMVDLANAMKQNPRLRVMINSGYYDLATPYREAWYEGHHLSIPAALDANIEYYTYESGHMVYLNERSLAELHENVTGFIARTTRHAH